MTDGKKDLVFELKNCGPIERFTLKVPVRGGLVVATGSNGSGKSQMLSAIAALVSGKGKPSLRDGALAGHVSGVGGMLAIGSRTKRQGELEIVALPGSMDIAGVVDPPFSGDAAADAHAIKALVRMVGVPDDPAPFYDMLGGHDAYTALGIDDTDGADIVVKAGRIKRALDAVAKKHERETERLEGEAVGVRAAVGEYDEALATDAAQRAATAEHERAVRDVTSATERRKAGLESVKRAAEAMAAMAEQDVPSDDDMAAASTATDVAGMKAEEGSALIERLKSDLKDAEADHQALCERFIAAQTAENATESARTSHDASLRIVAEASGFGDFPTDDDVADAELDVSATRQMVVNCGVAEQADAQRKRADTIELQAAKARDAGIRARANASATETVLSALLNEAGITGLRIVAGRLVTETSRGETYFRELSPGERTHMALDIALPIAVKDVPEGECGVIVMDQRLLQDLDPDNRAAVHERLDGSGVCVLSALPTDGPLAAHVYGDGDAEGTVG